MMSRVLLRAHDALCRTGTEDWTVVVFGAKECTDVPLETLASKGRVYLIDVDVESLRVARDKIQDPSLKDRVVTVSMDASLFENRLLDKAQDLLYLHPMDMDRAFRSILAMNRGAAEAASTLSDDVRLPIGKNSVDLVVSSMTLSQFMIGYVQLLVKIFLDQYGRERTRAYFLSESPTELRPEEGQRVDELQRSTSDLARRVTAKHIRELSRIAKPGGVVVLSDHALHGRCAFLNDDEVEVDVPSLIPYSKNLEEDKALRFREDRTRPLPASLRADRTRPDARFVVEGTDALRSILEQDGGMKPLDEQGWWWVTERSKAGDEGSGAWNVSYVEAFILLSRM
jgi:SAM-dependent methyltransferase